MCKDEHEQLKLDARDVLALLVVDNQLSVDCEMVVHLAESDQGVRLCRCTVAASAVPGLSEQAAASLKALGHEIWCAGTNNVDFIRITLVENSERETLEAARRVRLAATRAQYEANRDRLRTDARDVLASLEQETGLVGQCSLNVDLAASFAVESLICGAMVFSDGRRGLSARAEDALRALGWHVQYGRDVGSELSVRTEKMSAHARLRAVARLQNALGEHAYQGRTSV